MKQDTFCQSSWKMRGVINWLSSASNQAKIVGLFAQLSTYYLRYWFTLSQHLETAFGGLLSLHWGLYPTVRKKEFLGHGFSGIRKRCVATANEKKNEKGV